MSNYSPTWIDRNIWLIINSTIRLYPLMYVQLVDGEDEIMNSHIKPESNISSGYVSDPTASIAIRLVDNRHLKELNRKCEAINYCLSQLSPDHHKVVCLRFWGTESTDEAYKLARSGIALCGFRYEDMKRAAGYSDRQAKRIIHKLVIDIGKNLGEI